MRANRGTVGYLLVVKWDRFSRDATGALSMIRTLDELGVEVQAVEQPIDRNVPEQFMMLAIYVAAPEVENRRRSLATKRGMSQAMREGRYCNRVPKGYRRDRDEHDLAVIVPDEDAQYILRGFEIAARTDLPLEEIRRRLAEDGFKCSKNQFTLLLRNPLYAGKILIPAWRDEPEELVDGLHEAIVSETLFQRVQQRFEADRYGRKQRGRKGSYKVTPELVLRGHLMCADCKGLLTGSASRGNGGRYLYYFCHHCGQQRFRAEVANAEAGHYLNQIAIAPEVAALYEDVVEDLARDEKSARTRKVAKLRQGIEAMEEKLFRTVEAFVEGQIAPDSYGRLKGKYQDQLNRLRLELESLDEMAGGFVEQLRFAVKLLSNLGLVYRKADYRGKHALLGSIFPEKLVYRDDRFRTSPESEIIALLGGKTHKMKNADRPATTGVLKGSPGRR